MSDLISRKAVIDWFRCYGHMDEPIPFETLVSDLRDAIPSVDAAPVVHGCPVYHNRPARYEHYEMVQQTENGEPLYKRQYYTLQDNPVAYCSECGKRMCSRFTSFCPNCGAKMDGKEDGADHE